MRTLSLLVVLVILASCKEQPSTMSEQKNEELTDKRFRESYRPQFHFTPPTKWMNDPNGLLFHNGTYHLFYQYYPDDIVWGPMHWGHATSKDLISWDHKPVALFPDEHGYIFSGSAVMDINNTSGLGTKENPPMVAIFTYHDPVGEKAETTTFQTQGIAYSLDEGDTWQKYKGNPVIGNDGIKDFRDPKVFWHDATHKWIMLLVAGDHLQIFNSPDLKAWTYLSEFGKNQGAHGGVWECPDLFELAIEGTAEKKWVLFISINPGAPNGGSGTQYFVGEFDGNTFTSTQEENKWVDWGADNYAGVTYNGLPNNQRTFIGWMSNWNYAQITPTEVWRSAMTLPRTLTLHKTDDYILKNFPVRAIHDYQYKPIRFDEVTNDTTIDSEDLQQSRLDFTIQRALSDFTVTIKNDLDEHVLLGYNAAEKQFFIDRQNSGKTDFESRFASQPHTAPAILESKENISFSVFIDASSIELFVDGGATVLTEQVFPNSPYNQIAFSGKATFTKAKISKIKRIWK